MSTPGMQLISRVVKGRSEFQSVNRWGITEADFLTNEEIGMWRHIVGVSQVAGSKGSVPGMNSMKEEFPHFMSCDDESMSTELLCQQVRNRRLVMAIKMSAQEAIENAEMGPTEAAAIVQKSMMKILELGANKSIDVGFSSAFDDIMHDYNLGEAGYNTARATWPWKSLQDATGGIQEDDYIIFYGRPKSMKSWVLCKLIAHLFWNDKKVLIYTKEMSPKNIYKRIAACLAEIPYQDLRGARLDVREKIKLVESYNYVKQHSDLLVCLSGRDVPNGGDTVAWFRSKAEYYKPDVGAIDGMYLMSATGQAAKTADHLRVMSISREISAMRLDLQMPTIATAQANRKAASHSNAELDEIAHSDAIAQDATLAIRVINEKGKPTIALVVGGSREFELHGVRIGGIPATDFSEKELMTTKEVLKAKDGDTGDQDSPDAHAKVRTPRTSKDDKEVQRLIDQQIKDIV